MKLHDPWGARAPSAVGRDHVIVFLVLGVIHGLATCSFAKEGCVGASYPAPATAPQLTALWSPLDRIWDILQGSQGSPGSAPKADLVYLKIQLESRFTGS